jgi:hypothetical protein
MSEPADRVRHGAVTNAALQTRCTDAANGNAIRCTIVWGGQLDARLKKPASSIEWRALCWPGQTGGAKKKPAAQRASFQCITNALIVSQAPMLSAWCPDV